MIANSLITAASFTPNSLQYPSAWVGHLPFAAWLIRDISPKLFVELGTHSGNSYFSFCQSVAEAGIKTKCYAIDTWLGDEHAEMYGEDVFVKVHAHNREHYAGFSRLLRMTFDDALTYFADQSIGLLHIDGLHTYEAVRHDFETWLPKLAPGAVVLFHDTNVRKKNFGVWKLWKELQAHYPNNLEFAHSQGLGVLQLNDAPDDNKREWLQSNFSEKLRLINYFAALGYRQLERFELNEVKQHVANLNQHVANLNQHVANLNQIIADRDGQIVALHHSTSWRITWPLRIIGRQLIRCRRVVELVRPAILRGGGLKSALKKAVQLYRREVLAGIKHGSKNAVKSESRIEELTKFATREGRGIEIGPWCHPVVPKRLGYNCLILDVFDTSTLRQRASEDHDIPDDLVTNIEEVDLVGSSTEIARLVGSRNELGTFDYIISSHNFEHLPDPIRFLQGCEEVLKPGGILTMAIPDRRGCFDYFRPNSTLAQLIEAYFEQRDRPTQAQIFERWSLSARLVKADGESISFPIDTNPAAVVPFHSLQDAFRMWQKFTNNPDEIYQDTHCWVFTPASCELILSDLNFLGLIALEVLYISSRQNEFFIHIKKRPATVNARSIEQLEHFYSNRRRLMLRTYTESRP